MQKQIIACGVLTIGLAVFGCQNAHHDDNGSMPTTQKAEAAPQQDNTAVAQNDDTSATDTESQENETASTNNDESTESVAQTDEAQSDAPANSDEANTEEAQTDESASSDDGEQAEVAEIWDGTQFDADEFVAQVLEAFTQDPFSANTNTKNTPSQKKVNTASTDGDLQP